jgi:hypothetical protein
LPKAAGSAELVRALHPLIQSQNGSFTMTAHRTVCFGLAGLMSLLAACGTAEESSLDRGPASTKGCSVIGAELGGRYALAVEPRGEGGDYAQVLRFTLARGQTLAATMRRVGSAEIEAHLELFRSAGGGALMQSRPRQAAMPMGAEADTILIHSPDRAEEYLLFAADQQMTARASFQVDLIALGAQPPADLTATNSLLRGLVADLRAVEPRVQEVLDEGKVEETAGGLLAEGDIPSLSERADIRRMIETTNAVRRSLFEEMLRVNLSDASAEAVGQSLGELWQALRGPDHRLAN